MPLFNKIRKSQIKTEGMKKYLLYAMGEIVLVVVGILIALEINNWNEARKEREQEKIILTNLNKEFRLNNILLNKQRMDYQKNIKTIGILMDLMGKPEYEISAINTDSIISEAIDVSDFRPTSNVMLELIGSGKMNLITNNALKNELFKWTARMEEKKEAWETLDHFNESLMMPYLIKQSSLKNIDRYGLLNWKSKTSLKNNNFHLFQQLEFENNLDNHAWSVTYFTQTLDSLEVTSRNIIQLTD
jgi:hypothetical protein